MRRTHTALVALVALTALPACNKETPPTAEQPKAPDAEVRNPAAAAPAATPAEPAAAPAAAAAGQSRISEGPFEVALTPSGAYQAGKEGTVEIVLDAKAPYHVNDQYPIKFKVKEGAGVKFAAAVVGKDRAKLETMRATMPVAFTPESAGQHTVAGQLSFSVCTDENCLMEKRELSVVVDVK